MSPRWALALLSFLALWTCTGLLGLLLSLLRGESGKLRQGVRALALTWLAYLALLLLLSWREPVRTLAPGQSRCFSGLCFSAQGAEELQGFWARGSEPERLVRVTLQMSNTTSASIAEPNLVAALLDSRGRRWDPVPGLSGVRLDAPLPRGARVRTAPVFRLPADATGLRLELGHRGWSLHRLLLGDPESPLHRPTLLALPPATTP